MEDSNKSYLSNVVGAMGDVCNCCDVVVVIVNHLNNCDREVHSEGVVQHEAKKDHDIQHLNAC